MQFNLKFINPIGFNYPLTIKLKHAALKFLK